MVDRLLDKLEPQRRHLAYLVGLLVLTFVLTSVLAFQAQQTQAARARDAEARLESAVSEVQRNFATIIGQNVANVLLTAVPLPVLHPDTSLNRIMAVSRISTICPSCSPRVDPSGYLSMRADGSGLEMGRQPVSALVLSEILRHTRNRQFVHLNDTVGGALYFIDDGGVTRMVLSLTVLAPAGDVRRIVGAVIEEGSASALLRTALRLTPGFPNSFVLEKTNEELFVVDARVGQAALIAAQPDDDLSEPLVLSEPPVLGLTLRLGLRPEARELLAPGVPASISPVLLALVALIGGVLVLALLLVRREAELVRLRAEFISGVSHELRTPLAQIRMFTETLLLGRTRSDVERRRSLEIIDQEARRLTHLVENVLLFSRGEGGRQPGITPELTSFAGEIRRAIESFGPMCRTRSVEVRAELQEDIAGPVDRNALRQILVNLVENALKYGPEGQRITVGLALYDDMARIWVDDEGPGIPVRDRDRVFDSFQRLRREIEARVAGSGIGLSVVRELARLHGGSARAEGAPGGGARIVVEFPGAYLRAEKAAEMPAAS